ncbi:tigger transposable element, partial [Pseudoloma neurophilia]
MNCQKLRNAWKDFKDRRTLQLCSNMNGCEKLKPVFIHKYANPRPLKGVNVSLYFDYKFNSSAWMTRILLNEWLKDLYEQMISQDRQILMILDNVP